MPQVFISHCTEDRDIIEEEIIPCLQDEVKVEFWYAPFRIRTAENWERSIRDGLENSDWFIVVMSPRSAKSDWVRQEVHWAMEERKGRIVPLLLETCNKDDFHVGLRAIQAIDCTTPNKRKAIEILSSLWHADFTVSRTESIHTASELPTNVTVPEDSVLEECPDEDDMPNDSSEGNVLVTTDVAPIELVINRDFSNYTDEEQTRLLLAIKEFLDVSGDIRVICKRPGSVKITLALTHDQRESLLWAVEQGKFRELGVIAATSVNSENEPYEADSDDLEDDDYHGLRESDPPANRGGCLGAVSWEEHPDKTEDEMRAEAELAELKCSRPKRGEAKLRLRELIRRFPQTKTALKARKMLERLESGQ